MFLQFEMFLLVTYENVMLISYEATFFRTCLESYHSRKLLVNVVDPLVLQLFTMLTFLALFADFSAFMNDTHIYPNSGTNFRRTCLPGKMSRVIENHLRGRIVPAV
jgi:hypothetical protein